MAADNDALIAGRYRLVAPIGSGGMSMVWEAWDERLHRRVAVKQLRLQHGLPEREARLAADRAMREARITARLHHPHAVPVYDVVTDGHVPCLVMQYLPARSLQTVLKERGPLDPREVARIGSEIAGALAAAHGAGIVHRDVKPGNILLDDAGSAKITDFGISHALGDVTLTSTGMVTGTPAYLAPEAARGEPSGYPADVFALGATLFTALEGVPPVGESDNPIAVLHQVASGKLNRPTRNTPLTVPLERMLSLDPAARPSMSQVRDELASIARGPAAAASGPAPQHPSVPPSTTVTLPAAPQRPARRRRGPLAALAIVAALLLGGGAAILLVTLGDRSGTHVGSGTHSTALASTPHSAPPSTRTTTSARSTSTSPPTSTSARSTSTSPRTSSRADTGPTAGQLVSAIDGYYTLLPDDTDAAWPRLTSDYQRNHAGGRQGFDDFWGQFSSVTTSGTHAIGRSEVETTLTYTYNDGRTTQEVTDFGLVDDGGTLKIASSDVVG